MKFHPYAEIFPWLEGAELDELAADIKANGLREPIWLYEGQILDGRNRFLACEKANVKPHYRPYEGDDPLAFVVSVNIHRRHLNASQRAMAAAEIATLRKGTNQHTAIAASSQAKAAEVFGVSADSIQRARKVLNEGSTALKKAVKTGAVAVSKAATVIDLPKREQLAAATAPDEPARPEWEPDEDEQLVAMERQVAESIDRIMQSDDKFAAAHVEIKRQAAEIVALKASRDHYQNETGAAVRLVKARDREIEKLKKELAKVREEAA